VDVVCLANQVGLIDADLKEMADRGEKLRAAIAARRAEFVRTTKPWWARPGTLAMRRNQSNGPRTMPSRCTVVAVMVSAGLFAPDARAETIADLVKTEEGVGFVGCNLTPRPSVAGEEIYVVVPARF
jgi:hypothetical protein